MDFPAHFRAVIDGHLATHPDAQLYFLLDHAGLPGLLRKLDSHRLQWVSLFDGTRESGALAVAPILVFVGRMESQLPRLFFDWVAQHGAYASAVTLLDSPLAIDVLQRRLVARLESKLSENMDVMLRFFDPRILAQLRTTLTPEQAAAFFGVAAHWWYLDRAGVLWDFDTNFASTDAAEVPLVLCPEQEFALIDASEADQTLALLNRKLPNLMEKIPLPERYEKVFNRISDAKKLGLESIHDFMIHIVKSSEFINSR